MRDSDRKITRYLFRDALAAAYAMRLLKVRFVGVYSSRAVGRDVSVEITLHNLVDIIRGGIYPPNFWKMISVHPASMQIFDRLDARQKDSMKLVGLWPETEAES